MRLGAAELRPGEAARDGSALRILVLANSCPVPADDGTKLRTLSLLRALAADGHEVTLLTFGQARGPEAHPGPLSGICLCVEALPEPRAGQSPRARRLLRLRSLFSGLPSGVVRLRSPLMKRRIQSIIEQGEIDVIVCEQTDVAVNLPPLLSVPVIVDYHNAEHVIFRRYAAVERNPAKRAYALLEVRKTRAWEQRCCQRANLALACSEDDRKVLSGLSPATPVAVAQSVIDVGSYTPDSSCEDPGVVLYQGGMDWFPNRDAVGFFLSAILPRVRALAPEAKLVVAGRNPPSGFISRFAAVPGVEFTGTVPDMRPVIARAAVCVVPLRIGSGTRLKILESAAMAKPVVSTRVGAEGLNFVDGQEIFLADAPEEFAQAVASLLLDATRRRTVGQLARQKVETLYDLPSLRGAVRLALAGLTLPIRAVQGNLHERLC